MAILALSKMKTLPNSIRWIAVIPVSMLTAAIVYYVLKYVFSLLTFLAPDASYGDLISIVATGLASHTCIIAGSFVAPKYQVKVASSLMAIAILFLAYIVSLMIHNKDNDFVDQLKVIVILAGSVTAYLKIRKEGKVTFDSFLVG